MERKIVTILVVFAVVGSSALAVPSLGYWDIGAPGSTHQVWSFDNAPDDYSGHTESSFYTLAPDIDMNPYGDPLANVSGTSSSAANFQYNDNYTSGETRQGVWSGDPVVFDLTIPNTESTGGSKIMWMEVKAAYAFSPTPSVTAYDAQSGTEFQINMFHNEVTDDTGDASDNDYWKTIVMGWEIIPNPQSEDIHLEFFGTGGYVDQITVDTICVPAPGAILLAGIGTAVVGFIKRKRTIC